MNYLPLLVSICLLHVSAAAQVGGGHVFESLSTSVHARTAGLGGINVSRNNDINFFYANPALLLDSLAGTAGVSYQFLPAGIGMANITYAHNFHKKVGVMGIGIQHVNYGKIEAYDAAGLALGEFTSGETIVVAGKSFHTGNFYFGVNAKGVFSNIAGYRASGVGLDVGGTFIHPNKSMTAALVVKNMGVVVTDYSETSSSRFPFDVQLGTTFKPAHMPLRFSITAFQLAKAGRRYELAISANDKPGTLDKVLRHLNLGTEILMHKNVQILLGYNFLTHQELKLENAGGSAGFTAGVAFKVRTFEFIFSRGSYVVGNAAYTFTLLSDLNTYLRKKML